MPFCSYLLYSHRNGTNKSETYTNVSKQLTENYLSKNSLSKSSKCTPL